MSAPSSASLDPFPDPPPSAPPGATELRLERWTLTHVGGLCAGAAWAYGGNADWSRNACAVWASLGIVLTLLLVRETWRRRHCLPRMLHALWPLAAFNLLVLASLAWPNFRAVHDGTLVLYVPADASPWLPSTARPAISAHALWLFDAIYLSAFNLVLAVRRRGALRALLLALAVNALALSVFGTLQKLVHAPGLYFGLQPSPQPRFFASFIYANHWGAFALLMLAAALGLWFHFLRRHTLRELSHSPAMLVLLAVGALAISAPLSGSRSASAMALLALGAAVLRWILLVRRQRRGSRSSSAGLALGAVAALAVLILVAYDLGRHVIAARVTDTRKQIAELHHSDEDSRLILYRDTWRMARARWLFGWGLGSYPTVFYLYNTQQISPVDGLPHYYHDAHSDWLQAVAEVGVTGTALLALCGAVPCWLARRRLGRSPLSIWLLGGCGLVLAYALVEFPFGNTAVVIAFWLCFFAALQYVRAEHT